MAVMATRLPLHQAAHAADEDAGQHQAEVVHARIEEGDEGGDQHADAGPDDAAAGALGRAHALQPKMNSTAARK